jgi:hypothetical protein
MSSCFFKFTFNLSYYFALDINNLTCFMSIFGLSIILGVYISMNFVLSSIINGITLLCWCVLIIMKKEFELNKIFER